MSPHALTQAPLIIFWRHLWESLINAFPMDKDLLKIDVREPKAVNIDDALVYPDGKMF